MSTGRCVRPSEVDEWVGGFDQQDERDEQDQCTSGERYPFGRIEVVESALESGLVNQLEEEFDHSDHIDQSGSSR